MDFPAIGMVTAELEGTGDAGAAISDSEARRKACDQCAGKGIREQYTEWSGQVMVSASAKL